MKRSAKNFVGSLPIIFQIAMQSRGWSRWETHNLSTRNHLLRQKDAAMEPLLKWVLVLLKRKRNYWKMKPDKRHMFQQNLSKVREGRPSLACREDEERFCLCGRVERKGTTTWRWFSSNFGSAMKTSVSPPGSSVEHVTYRSSWIEGRGWKSTGRRRS